MSTNFSYHCCVQGRTLSFPKRSVTSYLRICMATYFSMAINTALVNLALNKVHPLTYKPEQSIINELRNTSR